MLQSLVMQTTEDVMELTKQVSEIGALLKESTKMNQTEHHATVERLVRHRQEINSLKEHIKELEQSKKLIVRALGIIGALLGGIITAAAVDLMETMLFK